MTFGRFMIWGITQSAVRLVAGLAVTKILSVYLGPSGLAVFAQFQSFAGLMNNFVNGGIPHGVVKFTASLRNRPVELQRLNRTIAGLSIAFALGLGLLLAGFRYPLAEWLFKMPGYESYVILLGLLMVFTSVNASLCAQLNGLQLSARFFVIQSALAILSLCLMAALVPTLGLSGALLSIPVSQVLLFGVTLGVCRRIEGISFADWRRPALNSDMTKALLKYGLLLLVTTLSITGSQLYVRDLLITAHSTEVAGHWQAVARVSESLIIVTTSMLTSYYLPQLSGISATKRSSLIRHYFKWVLPAFITTVIALVLLREKVILVLFSPAFLPARDLFIYQLLGDIARMVGWIASMALLAGGHTRIAMASEVVYAMAFAGLALLLIGEYGAMAAALAYLCAMSASALVLWIAYVRIAHLEMHQPRSTPL